MEIEAPKCNNRAVQQMRDGDDKVPGERSGGERRACTTTAIAAAAATAIIYQKCWRRTDQLPTSIPKLRRNATCIEALSFLVDR